MKVGLSMAVSTSRRDSTGEKVHNHHDPKMRDGMTALGVAWRQQRKRPVHKSKPGKHTRARGMYDLTRVIHMVLRACYHSIYICFVQYSKYRRPH